MHISTPPSTDLFPIDDDLLPWATTKELTATAAPPAVGRPVVVIPCSARKKPLPEGVAELPAAQLYQGSYFTKCLTAAQAIPRARVVIVSAKYGLITPRTPIRPYNKRLNPRTADHNKHRDQAAAMGRSLRHAPEVIALGGKDYADAAAAVWPHLVRPLAGAAIGVQLQRLTRIAESDDPRATALDYAAQAAAEQ